MKNPRKRFLYGLIISVFILSMSSFIFLICVFTPGIIGNKNTIIWFVVSFVSGIIACIYMMKCINRLDFIIDYGDPVLQASNHIKEMVRNANMYGVENLAVLVEKQVKKKLDQIVKQEVEK